MKKLLALAAAAALVSPVFAQVHTGLVGSTSTRPAQTTAGTSSGAQPVSNLEGRQQTLVGPFTLSPSGQLTDRAGNALTLIGTAQYIDQLGNIYTVDGNGRLINQAGAVVSAPGAVLSSGQSGFTATVPSLPGLPNQTITMGPQSTSLGEQTVQAPVAGVSEGSFARQVPASTATNAGAPGRTGTGGGTITTSTGRRVVVGSPPRVDGRNADVSRTGNGGTFLVRSFDGSTLTLVRSNGSLVTLRVDASSSIPSGLTSGRQVFVTTRTVSGVVLVDTVSFSSLRAELR